MIANIIRGFMVRKAGNYYLVFFALNLFLRILLNISIDISIESVGHIPFFWFLSGIILFYSVVVLARALGSSWWVAIFLAVIIYLPLGEWIGLIYFMYRINAIDNVENKESKV